MPVHCCVPLCKQRGVTDSDGSKVSFHRFPKDAMIYKKWIVAIKRDEGPEFQVGKSTKVCSKHFRSSDFIPSVASGRSLLRDSAVPSVFAFSKEKKERKPPKPCASPQVRSQNSVLGPGVLGDELMHSPDEVKAAPKNNEIARLRDELCQIKEQLVAAKGIIGQLGFEKASLSCQLAAERERTAPFTVERFKDCNEDMLFHTGLPSYNHFKNLLVYLNPGDDGCNVLRSERTESSEPRSSRGRKRKLSTENELFLVLVRLRLGLFEDDLAHRFCIAQSTVSRICTSWINFLYAKLGLLPLWAPRKIVDTTMPPEFKEKYSSTRVILDATEIQCEVPSSLSLQSTTYSPYKSSNTFKGLIGVLPNGFVAFVSELFTGSSSDKECVIRSGFLDLKFDDEDAVMADNGFRIEDLLEKNGVKLNLPPFLKGGTFSPEEVKSTKEIAALRIHVERRIQRIKAFHIFDRPIPLTLAPLINQIWTVTAILSNFQSSLMQQSSGKPQQEP
ncbi:uncharacterized protein LOC142792512 [Rhipicephalus microplus]|uniref:uncharacterized protein LOC142792512 n=1 Tax=Rhipicephalus microplus TaxID=6941 RepID=UPI003F6BBC72